MAEPSVVQVDLSSSAMNASLELEFTNSGNSEDRNLKSNARQNSCVLRFAQAYVTFCGGSVARESYWA